MQPLPNTITPRTPLTLTELETLATLLDSGSQHMTRARDASGLYAWNSGGGVGDALDDMFAGFYQLRDNTACLAAGDDGWPYSRPEAAVVITATA